jgi:thymidylate kinase
VGSHRAQLVGPSRGAPLSLTRRPRPGLVITVAGPDGAGKTTFCEALIAGVLHDRDVRRIHHRVGLFPVRGGTTSDPTRPHAQMPYARGVSEAKLLYLFGDALAGWLFSVRPFLRRGGCVIVERGWWDLAVDPARYRLRPHARLVRGLGRCLPRSDLLIVLEAPAALLATRKDEISEAELARQVLAWRDVVPDRQRCVYLDVSLPLEEVVSLAAAELARLEPARNRRSM